MNSDVMTKSLLVGAECLFGILAVGATYAAAACDSGGVGASSCSIGSGDDSCSVSCKSGYYACCTIKVLGPDVCNCIKESS